MPDVRNTFLKKGRSVTSFESKVPKYNFLRKEKKEIEMISFEIEVNKCKPTTLHRPPQYNCVIKPPITMTNLLFTQLTITRVADKEIISTLEPGESENIYAIPYNIWTEKYKRGC